MSSSNFKEQISELFSLAFIQYVFSIQWKPEILIKRQEIIKKKGKKRKNPINRIDRLMIVIGTSIFLLILTFAMHFHWISYINVFSWEDYPSKAIMHPPSSDFWFGTTLVFDDVFQLVVFGARALILILLPAMVISIIFGIFVGILISFQSRFLNFFFNIIADLIISFPILFSFQLLRLFFYKILFPIPNYLSYFIFFFGLIGIFPFARLIQCQITRIKTRVYLQAAQISGISSFKYIILELLLFFKKKMLIYIFSMCAILTLNLAGLFYIGFWPYSPFDGKKNVYDYSNIKAAEEYSAWWIWFYPGLFLTLTTLGFLCLSEGLRAVSFTEELKANKFSPVQKGNLF